MVTKTRSVDGVDAESVSVPDINMASAYYACVFDAEVIRDRTPCAMRVDRRTYSLAAKTPCPAETHSVTVADVDLAVARIATKGGRIVQPVVEDENGAREGSVQDPFGHMWIISSAPRH